MSKVVRETISRAEFEVLSHQDEFGRFRVVGRLLGLVRVVDLEDISEGERSRVIPGATLTVREYYEQTPGRRKRHMVELLVGFENVNHG